MISDATDLGLENSLERTKVLYRGKCIGYDWIFVVDQVIPVKSGFRSYFPFRSTIRKIRPIRKIRF